MIYGVNFRQYSLSQSQEGDVLSYSECKLGKNFQVYAPGLHWGGLKVPPQTPQLHNSFSRRNARRKTGTRPPPHPPPTPPPQKKKIAGYYAVY